MNFAKLILFISIAIITSVCFSENSNSEKIPSWLEHLMTVQNVDASEYLYYGKHVFYTPARCCDIAAELYDENGTRICSLEGGLANHIEKKCLNFKKQAKLIRKIERPKIAATNK